MNTQAANPDWDADSALIQRLHLGLLETLRYLYTAPTFEQFEAWVLEKNGGSIEPERIAPGASHEPALTPGDLAFWHENGYVVLHDAVTPDNARLAAQAIYEFLGVDPLDPDTWYGKPHGHTIWVPLLHHPAFQANRNSPRIHHAFAQIWGRSDLWVTFDQGGFNPPERPGWKFPGPHLHWDTSLAMPIPFGVQGILYLTDTAPDQGAFTCVPGFHRRIEAWLQSLPPGADPRRQDLASLGAVPIPGRAGDLIIWHQALPHGSSPNRATLPRVVQYIKMLSSQPEPQRPWR